MVLRATTDMGDASLKTMLPGGEYENYIDDNS